MMKSTTKFNTFEEASESIKATPQLYEGLFLGPSLRLSKGYKLHEAQKLKVAKIFSLSDPTRI